MKYTSRKKLLGLTAAAVMTLAPLSSLADTAVSALVTGGSLNLRETASLSAKVLGQYPTGTLVEIVEKGDEWHKVSVNGKDGYMMSKYLSTATTSQTATVRTNTGIGLNVREEPSLHGTIITSVKNGGTVTVLQKGATWCRVSVDGKEGFMATQYLSFGGSGSSGSGTVVSGKVAVVNNPKATQVLNLRQSPSLNAKVLAYYRNGAKVTILQDSGSWYKVQTEDGKLGYMMKQYLRVTDETTQVKPFTATTMNVNGGKIVNMRAGASLKASILRTVPVGTKVTVKEHTTDWCKVEVDGQEGYISTWFLKW